MQLEIDGNRSTNLICLQSVERLLQRWPASLSEYLGRHLLPVAYSWVKTMHVSHIESFTSFALECLLCLKGSDSERRSEYVSRIIANMIGAECIGRLSNLDIGHDDDKSQLLDIYRCEQLYKETFVFRF